MADMVPNCCPSGDPHLARLFPAPNRGPITRSYYRKQGETANYLLVHLGNASINKGGEWARALLSSPVLHCVHYQECRKQCDARIGDYFIRPCSPAVARCWYAELEGCASWQQLTSRHKKLAIPAAVWDELLAHNAESLHCVDHPCSLGRPLSEWSTWLAKRDASARSAGLTPLDELSAWQAARDAYERGEGPKPPVPRANTPRCERRMLVIDNGPNHPLVFVLAR